MWADNAKQKKYFKDLKNSGSLRIHFKADVLFLASLSMVFVHLWQALVDLFLEKWNCLAPEAAAAFAKEFFTGRHNQWSHAYLPAGVANHTNGTESHNNQIKAGGTDWQLLPLPEFVERLVIFTRSKSCALADFHNWPKITEKMMRMSVTIYSGIWLMVGCMFVGKVNFASPISEWGTRVDAPRAVECVVVPSNGTVIDIMDSGDDASKASTAAVDILKSLLEKPDVLAGMDFDRAKKALTAANVLVEYPHLRPQHQDYWCSCQTHQNFGVCPHAIALCYKTGKAKVPPEHDIRPISSNRTSTATTTKRGGAFTNDTANAPAPRTPHHSGFAVLKEGL